VGRHGVQGRHDPRRRGHRGSVRVGDAGFQGGEAGRDRADPPDDHAEQPDVSQRGTAEDPRRSSRSAASRRSSDEHQQDLQQVEDENRRLSAGEFLPINSTTTTRRTSRTTADFQKTSKYQALPPQVQQGFENHVASIATGWLRRRCRSLWAAHQKLPGALPLPPSPRERSFSSARRRATAVSPPPPLRPAPVSVSTPSQPGGGPTWPAVARSRTPPSRRGSRWTSSRADGP
jgi:hypothetical protein